MGRVTDDGWESDRKPRTAQCEWCEATYDDSGLMQAFAAPLCPDCLDHLCVQCGDARAVGLDHQFAPMQMCQGCLDQAFEESHEARQEAMTYIRLPPPDPDGAPPRCILCGEWESEHLGALLVCPSCVFTPR